MPWYSAGTVAVTNNSPTVTGSGTSFSANARVGDAFRGPDGLWYEVTNVASATVLSIKPNYQSASNGAGAYAIAPMQGYVKDSADTLRSFVNQYGSKIASMGDVATENVLPVAKGGTGATDAGAALSNLGAARTGGSNTFTGSQTFSTDVTVNGAFNASTDINMAGSLSLLGANGQLNLPTAGRIRGDLSAPAGSFASRLFVQSSVANGNTMLSLMPNGTSRTAGIQLWSDPTNLESSSRFDLYTDGNQCLISAGRTGSAAYRDITMWAGGAERLRVRASGPVCIDASSDPGSLNSLYVGGAVSALTGFRCRAGSAGGQTNVFNINWTGTAQLWVDGTNVGTISTTSDYRIKQDIVPLHADFLDRISKYQVVEYRLRDFGIWRESEQVFQGLVADQAQTANPKAATGQRDQVDDEGNPLIQNLELIPIVTDCIGAVQQLLAMIKQRDTVIADLSARLAALEQAPQ